MTIKEIESASGLDRANIRFYEKEGLVSPVRLDNGYRSYSTDDLEVLKRIKLLRSLGMPVAEIRALADGALDLPSALARQLKQLRDTQKATEDAIRICERIREDRPSFASLDADKYSAEQPTAAAYPTHDDRLAYPFYPWRRFFARGLDHLLCTLVLMWIIGYVLDINLVQNSSTLAMLRGIIAGLLLLLFEPICLAAFGYTPGKAIFGLTLTSLDGGRLSFSQAFQRTRHVLFSGEAFYLPFLSLWRNWKSYERLEDSERMPWDSELSYTIRDTRPYRAALLVGAHALSFALLIVLLIGQMLPPMRGPLTRDQYIVNYDYYSRYLGLAQTRSDLPGENMSFGDVEPEIDYTLDDGIVTAVRYELRYEGVDFLIAQPDTELLLASLALAGAQPEVHLFSFVPTKVQKIFAEQNRANWQETLYGLDLQRSVDYQGSWEETSIGLWHESEDPDDYYHIVYEIRVNAPAATE